MADQLPIKHLDRRTQARYLARGVLAEKDLERHLKGLPDRAENATTIEVEQPRGDRAPTR